MVIPFEQCIARPETDGKEFPLTDHLEAVAWKMGDHTGDPPSKLNFLAGLMHDIGKARVKWQLWIRNLETSKKSKSVNHSPLGAAVFVMSAHRLLKKWELEDALLKRQLLLLARDIYDHHGKLGDIDESPPWQNTLVKEDLLECDSAVSQIILTVFLMNYSLDKQIFIGLEDAPDVWRNLYLNSKRVKQKTAAEPCFYLFSSSKCLF